MRTHTLRGGLAVVVALGVIAPPLSAAQAASRTWKGCSRVATKAAADVAGVPATLDGNPGLRRVFGDQAPSSTFTTVRRAFCADFDGDGDVDRAAMYACCTVSSPSPIVILRNNGTGFAIVYKRLGAPVFSFRRSGRALVLREPKYAASDANCCPSRIRSRRLRWTGSHFKSTVRTRHA